MLDTVLPALFVAPIVAALLWSHGPLLAMLAGSLGSCATVVTVATCKLILGSNDSEQAEAELQRSRDASVLAREPSRSGN